MNASNSTSRSKLTRSGRAVQFVESFGGAEALELREVPVPAVGAGQVRVRVTAAGLNPMDWFMTADPEAAARFGLSLPCGFGNDYAGVVDAVGEGALAADGSRFEVGDRVFGGAFSRSVADYVVVDAPGHIGKGGDVHRTPDGLEDRVAATLSIAGCTAAAAIAVINPGPSDTVLIGGAGGGVGVFAVQLARLAGARVIGTGSATSADALRALGAEPVAYGDGLADRIRDMAPEGITAAMDLHGTETITVARELGVPDSRMTTIAAVVDGVTPANGASAAPGVIEDIARLAAGGQIRVPIAATFSVDEVRAAVELQAGRHVHGKVVIDL
jgi:NADPH:quinone reductase-like Zn-dependent oxidoreductase